jgi:hypothetical protein
MLDRLVITSQVSPYLPTNKTLVYKRTFFFGGNNVVLFPVTSYGQLKTYFDTLNKQDNHTVALKQGSSN